MSTRILSPNGTTEAPSPQQLHGKAVTFCSILFDEFHVRDENPTPPDFFTDLNIDQIVASITAGRDEYNLNPFSYTPLRSVDSVNYRYDVLRDLENEALLECIRSFAQGMRAMRSHLAQADKLHYKYQKLSWFLDAVEIYCGSVRLLTRDLGRASQRSRGFLTLREYLAGYVESADFTSLVAETEKLKAALSGIRYSLHIDGKRIEVTRFNSEPDFGAHVLQTFDKFNQGPTREYRFVFPSHHDMNHVEAAILDLVAQLYPEIFSSLDEFCNRHRGYLNSTIATFDREVQFYIACIDYIERIKRAGLPFCYPTVTDRSKEVDGRDIFDLALAERLVRQKTPVVSNDFYLRDPERIIVVTGPNQGGKTTFARTFGQLHYLASIGCPVPGKEAKLFFSIELSPTLRKRKTSKTLAAGWRTIC
ncbi:MAG: DNA mismatch repair protein MutS [Acidobacteria bacterium]|nr:DNA mismatch repair protein MutS [Acidobacteriota bacterium]